MMDLVIRGRKFHLTLALMANIKKSHTSAGEGRGEEHLIFSAGGTAGLCSHYGNQFGGS